MLRCKSSYFSLDRALSTKATLNQGLLHRQLGEVCALLRAALAGCWGEKRRMTELLVSQFASEVWNVWVPHWILFRILFHGCIWPLYWTKTSCRLLNDKTTNLSLSISTSLLYLALSCRFCFGWWHSSHIFTLTFCSLEIGVWDDRVVLHFDLASKCWHISFTLSLWGVSSAGRPSSDWFVRWVKLHIFKHALVSIIHFEWESRF